MKITMLNTSDSNGGAAVACNRLFHSLKYLNVDVELLVQQKNTDSAGIISTTKSSLKKKLNFARFAYERFYFSLYEESKDIRFSFSPANTGEHISRHRAIRSAKIINIHWINFGFLSLKSIRSLVELNKPIVWTLHDMWAFTGGCHYSGECERYQQLCGVCPFLKYPKSKDLSNRILKQKIRMLKDARITFVTCSDWLGEKAKSSTLLREFKFQTIPNPVNTFVYKPVNRLDAGLALGIPALGKRRLLFGSMKVGDKRKGFAYFKAALDILKQKYPKTKDEIELMVFGNSSPELLSALPYPTHNLGFINSDEDLAKVYEISTGNLNKAVKRNLDRFPEDFMFQLSEEEFDNLKFQFGIASQHGGRRSIPIVFTEHGALMA